MGNWNWAYKANKTNNSSKGCHIAYCIILLYIILEDSVKNSTISGVMSWNEIINHNINDPHIERPMAISSITS